MRILFINIWVILILVGCQVSQTSVDCEFEREIDNIKLWTFLDSGNDTLVFFEGIPKDRRISLELDKVNLPVLLHMEILNEVDTSFIIENREGTCIRQNKDKTFTIEGSSMESIYHEIREILNERYNLPLYEVGKLIENLESKTFLTTQEKQQLNTNLKKKERLEYYKSLYIKNLIEKNSAHELSLVLLIKELDGAEKDKKEVFESLSIKNKNSNLYKFTEAICQ